MSIKLSVLGEVGLSRDGVDCSSLLVQPKRFGLLVYLALDRPTRAHSRDELLAMFWPESTEEHARNALSQALFFIRRSIGPDSIITRGSESVDVNRELISSDLIAFESAGLDGDDELALTQYRGHLLPGFHVDGALAFEGWLSGTRERLRTRAATSARALIDRSRAGGDMSGMLHWARIAQSLSPHDERAVWDEMQAHHSLGDRVAGLRAFEAFTARLAEDLELEPSRELTAFAARIRATPNTAPHLDQVEARRGSESPLTASRRWRGARTFAAASAALGIAVAWRGVARSGDTRAPDRGRFALMLPDSARLRWDGSGTTIAVSPDGSQLAYVGGPSLQLYRRVLTELTPHAIPGTEQAKSPSFSPDGRWLAYCSLGNLYRVALSGGRPVKIADSVQRYSWGDGDVVVFSPTRVSRDGALYRVSTAGGEATRLTHLDAMRGETLHTWPALLPGGKTFLFEIRRGPIDSTELAVGRIDDGTIIRLGIAGYHPRYLAIGQLMFSRLDGSLYTVSFDARRLRVIGAPRLALSGVLVKTGGATEAVVARNGTLVYLQPTELRRLVLIDRRGAVRPLPYKDGGFATPRLSPDGRHIAVVARRGTLADVWAGDVDGSIAPVSRDGHSDAPEWSDDGANIAWHSRENGRDAVKWRPVNEAPVGRIAEGASAFSERGGSRLLRMDRWLDVERATGNGSVRDSVPVAAGRMIRVSPDGQWITVTAREVFVQRLTAPFDVHQISTGGGSDAVWGRTSGRLYYRVAGKFVVASLALGSRVTVQRVDTLFDDHYWSLDNSRVANYDVSRDESAIVAVESRGVGAEPILILHWVKELGRSPPSSH